MSTTRKTLSDDAKNARMEAWAAKLGLSKTQLKEFQYKYGPYAYTIMQKAMSSPDNILKYTIENYDRNKDFKRTPETIKYLLDNDISSDMIAQIVGEKSTLKVDNAISQAKIDAARREADGIISGKEDVAAAKKKEEQKKADETQQRVVAKADKKKAEKKTQTKVQDQKKEEPKKDDVPTIQEQLGLPSISDNTITVDKITLSTDPAKNYKDLETQAYQNFAKYEAKYTNFYLDCNLNPTIGVGHLVLPYSNLDSKLYHEKFLELPLTKKVGGKEIPMTKEEKEAQYKFLRDELKKVKEYRRQGYSKEQALAKTRLGADRIPGAGWNLTSSQMTKGYLNENGMRATFNKDFAYIYNETKRNVKGIDNYPLPTQLVTLHTVFNRGNSSRFSGKRTQAEIVNAAVGGNEIKKDTIDAARTLAGLPMKYNKKNKLAYGKARRGGTARA